MEGEVVPRLDFGLSSCVKPNCSFVFCRRFVCRRVSSLKSPDATVVQGIEMECITESNGVGVPASLAITLNTLLSSLGDSAGVSAESVEFVFDRICFAAGFACD